MFRGQPAGFSLIEILAAVSVLSILLVLSSQMIAMVSKTVRSGKARVDNFSQTRVVLGLIDRDVQSMVLRPDVAAFTDDSGASACAFYTRMAGAEGDRRLSLVQYRVEDSASNPRLTRLDYGLDYGTLSPARQLVFNNTAALADLDKALSQEIAEGIIRFEWQFITADGSLVPDFHYDYNNPKDPANTGALVISVLVLDAGSFRLARDAGKLGDLVSAFSGTPGIGRNYGDYWRGLMNAPGFGSGLPRPVLESLRVFDRSIHIPLLREDL